MSNKYPTMTDDNESLITVTFNGKGLRGWQYANAQERRLGMVCAYEYIEGWRDGRIHLAMDSLSVAGSEA